MLPSHARSNTRTRNSPTSTVIVLLHPDGSSGVDHQDSGLDEGGRCRRGDVGLGRAAARQLSQSARGQLGAPRSAGVARLRHSQFGLGQSPGEARLLVGAGIRHDDLRAIPSGALAASAQKKVVLKCWRRPESVVG